MKQWIAVSPNTQQADVDVGEHCTDVGWDNCYPEKSPEAFWRVSLFEEKAGIDNEKDETCKAMLCSPMTVLTEEQQEDLIEGRNTNQAKHEKNKSVALIWFLHRAIKQRPRIFATLTLHT